MKIYSWYFWSWSLLNHISIQNRLSLKSGTRNGEWGMRLTIFHEILHSEQFEGTEFIDDDSFVWFLTPANGGRCHLSGHSFGRRAANASILMKFRTLHKCRAVNSMVTKFFYKFWRLSILKSVNVGTCHLLGLGFGSFECRTANASILMKFCTRHKLRVVNSIVTIVFCDFRCLSKFDTCWHWHLWSFFSQFWTKNGKSPNFDEILYFAQIEHDEFNSDNSFTGFLTPANIDNCQYWYLLSFRPRFSTKNGKCFSFDKILYFTQNEGGEFNGFDIERCKWVPQKNKT